MRGGPRRGVRPGRRGRGRGPPLYARVHRWRAQTAAAARGTTMAHCPLRPLLRLLVLGSGWRRCAPRPGSEWLWYAGPRPGGRAWERGVPGPGSGSRHQEPRGGAEPGDQADTGIRGQTVPRHGLLIRRGPIPLPASSVVRALSFPPVRRGGGVFRSWRVWTREVERESLREGCLVCKAARPQPDQYRVCAPPP